MPIELIVGIFSGFIGMALGIFGYQRLQKHDHKNEGYREGTVMVELGYIKSGVEDIKRKQELQDGKLSDILTRLVAAESSIKQAHKRIDEIKEANL